MIDQYREAEARVWAACDTAPVERRVLLQSGGAVRVQEVGDGPPVVFLHGASIAGTSWCTLAAGLALLIHTPMTRSMVKRALRQFGVGKAIDSGTFDDDMLEWAYMLLRHTDTLANDVRSTPKLFTPIAGQNRAVLLTDELLAKLTMPVLFLWGEDDPNGGASVAHEFAPRLPNAELAIVPGAEHAPWLDDLDVCVEHTQRFLTA